MPDVLKDDTAPALSATQDGPVVSTPTEEPPAEPAAAETPTAEADATTTEETPSDTAKAEEAKEEEAKSEDKTPAWMKAEITKERNRRRAAEEKASRLESDLSRALALGEQNRGKTEAEATKSAADTVAKIDAEDPRPVRENFTDPNEYDSALVEWSTRRAMAVARVEIRKEQEQRTAKERAEKREAEERARIEATAKTWAERQSKFTEEKPDFADVAFRPDVQITDHMGSAIVEAENGPAIAYHLGEHPDLAAKISALSPVQQVIEIGKISLQLSTPPKASASKLPPPIEPIGATSSSRSKTLEEMSMDEYAAHRKAQMEPVRPSVFGRQAPGR